MEGNIFDNVLGTNFAKAERNNEQSAIAEQDAICEAAERRDEKVEQKYLDLMASKDLFEEFATGNYFNTSNMEPDEVTILNAMLSSDKLLPHLADGACDILRKYVQAAVRKVAEND